MKKFFLYIIFFAITGNTIAHKPIYPEFKDYGSLGGDIFLDSTLGYKIHSNEYNHIKIIFFGFISCPDICPTTLNIINQSFKDVWKKIF